MFISLISVSFNSIKDYQSHNAYTLDKASYLSIPSRIINSSLSTTPRPGRATFNSIKDYQISEYCNFKIDCVDFQFHQGLSSMTHVEILRRRSTFNSIKDYLLYTVFSYRVWCFLLSIPSRIINDYKQSQQVSSQLLFQFHQGLSFA